MTPERIAEWRKFALEALPQISRLSDESDSARVVISTALSAILELADVLTAERERSEKALEILYEILSCPELSDYTVGAHCWDSRFKELNNAKH